MKDRYSKNEIMMPFEHYLVHQGKMNMLSMYHTVTASSTKEFGIRTAAQDTHAVIGIVCSGQALIKVYENPTSAAFGPGSTVTCMNMNRHSALKSSLTACLTPTWKTATAKTPIFTELIPGGEKNQTMVGGGTRTNTEVILSASSYYIFQITNQAGSTIGAHLNIEFYELEV